VRKKKRKKGKRKKNHRTISPIEAKNLIYINTLGLDRNLLHGLDKLPLIQPLRVKIFVFERDSGSGRSLLRGKISGLII
jgi:hypothetical protein